MLITSHGYIDLHATRTGDYDALLTLFTTLSGLLFFTFCETQKPKHLYSFFLFIGLAVLTKSIAGLLFLPAFFAYSIIQKQFISLLKNRHFYIGLCSFLTFVLGYYLLREYNNAGYIAAVQNNEFGGRYFNVLEDNKQDFSFFYTNFIDFQLTSWYLLVPCGFIIGLTQKDKKINRITLFSSLMILTFFIVISSSQTKLQWYDVPLYTFLAILIAIFIYYIFILLENFNWLNQTLAINVAPFVFLFLIMITPYQKILIKTYKPQEYDWDKKYYEISYFLKSAINGKHDIDNHYICSDYFNTHMLFYVKILNDKGVRISSKDWKKLAPEDFAITNQPHVKKYIEEHYKQEIVLVEDNILTYRILK